jgi:hypothetical protein
MHEGDAAYSLRCGGDIIAHGNGTEGLKDAKALLNGLAVAGAGLGPGRLPTGLLRFARNAGWTAP